MISLGARDIDLLFRPKRCGKRAYLAQHSSAPAPRHAFGELLVRLHKRHEADYLQSLGEVFSCVSTNPKAQTERAFSEPHAILYRPWLHLSGPPELPQVEVSGTPDFVIRTASGPVIRNVTVSRRITEEEHPEIFAEMSLYGWLFERQFGRAPSGLQLWTGRCELVSIPYDGGARALEALRELVTIYGKEEAPYSPFGVSKCEGCVYLAGCRDEAEAAKDPALVVGVSEALAQVFHANGTRTIEQMIERYDAASLAEVRVLHGRRSQRFGKAAVKAIQHAKALLSAEPIILQPLALCAAPNYVMLDLEGLPPMWDALDRVYLWGLQVYGERPSAYQSACAGFGADGDREGWDAFLLAAADIFREYGDIRFVHWAHYEKEKIKKYIDRYGDPIGVAERVLRACDDLRTLTQEAIVLPTYSYRLKELERPAGFRRTMDEYGGTWSVAKYIEACELSDPALRDAVMAEIRQYNEEDLAAMWSVLLWIQRLTSMRSC